MLSSFSNQMADAVSAVAPSVVQVRGRRLARLLAAVSRSERTHELPRSGPASGVVYARDVVLTTMRALGREDGLQVQTGDGRMLDGELAGWDPSTGLAVLRVAGLETAAAAVADTPARVGHLALAVARSWSNAVTASAGIVSVIGGPLPTGRGREIAEIIRTTAPMHEGFSGGAFIDVSGRVLGIATSTEIRGLRVVIPASIAWATAATLLEHGSLKRGYLGLAGQAVHVKDRPEEARAALLVVGVSPESPAASAGIIVGDVLVEFDGQPVRSPEDLLDLLRGDRVGRSVPMTILRGGVPKLLAVTVGERPSQS